VHSDRQTGAGALPTDIAGAVERALAEDIGAGDLTAALIDPATQAGAHVVVKESATLCGTAWFDEVFRRLDRSVAVEWRFADGDVLPANAVVCGLRGPARSLLSGERTALNFLQTLSGTATAARRYSEMLAGTTCRLLDTRKTVPGLRLAQKYAVRCGGGTNHRIGLFDGVLIKENHIAAAGSVTAAVRAARRMTPAVLIEVEVENLEQLDEALDTDADRIMLDDFSPEDLRRAVAARDARAGSRKSLEASGGIELEALRAIAETGVDFISVGAVTKHVRAVDFSLRFR
jgi:nicotinate-nucleotide pyrophosphorylase (carboxylating)